MHPLDRARHAAAFAELGSGEREVVRLRHRYVTAAAVTRWAEFREPDPGLARLLQAIGAHLAQFLERRRAERTAEVAELTRRLAQVEHARP